MYSLSSLLQEGGIFMVPLLAASILAIAVIIERFAFFVRIEQGGEAFRKKLRALVREDKRGEALRWLKTLRGPVPVTAAAALETWSEGEEAVEAAMAMQARLEVPRLRRFLPILETCYSGAPLVGLLGTITGMMGTFHAVAQHLSHDPGANTTGITLGIGEALISTATGILIAVICLVFFNLFNTWAEGCMDASEVVAAEVVESLEAHHGHVSRQPAPAAQPVRS